MTCANNCIHTLLQLSYLLHLVLVRLVLLHGNAASLASYTLNQGLLNSSSSKHGISQMDNSKGLKPGSHVWGCGSSLQLLCLCHHRMASAASQSFFTLQLCPKRSNNNGCSVSKTESSRGFRWSNSWRYSNNKPGSDY